MHRHVISLTLGSLAVIAGACKGAPSSTSTKDSGAGEPVAVTPTPAPDDASKTDEVEPGTGETGAATPAAATGADTGGTGETGASGETGSGSETANSSETETGDESPAELDEDPPVPPFDPPGSLAAELTTWAGSKPPLLLANETSLLASDGTRTRELVALPISSARYDAAHRIIWFLTGAQLQALDLTAPAGPPIVVLDGFPADESLSLPEAGVWFGTERVPEYLSLRWKAGARVEVEATFDEIFNEDIAKALRKTKLVDAAWLATLATRRPMAVPKPAEATTKLRNAPVVGCDADEQLCQRGVPWPGSSWVLHVTEFDCGDYCYWSCELLDTKTGHTADPATLPTPTWDPTSAPVAGGCGPFFVDAGNTVIVLGRRLCRGSSCTELPGYALGFMSPGPTIEGGP